MRKISVMGILNATPDSFSDGGKFSSIRSALKRAERILEEGGDIIDIGGESTRPESSFVSCEEELKRVIPIIRKVRDKFPMARISIDTYKASVAAKALESGADIINDVWGGMYEDERGSTLDVAKEYKSNIILMHNAKDFLGKRNFIKYFFDDMRRIFENGVKKVPAKNIILDIGFGFKKFPEQNLEIVKNIELFKSFGCKILLGVSRKSTIKKIVGDDIDRLDIASAFVNFYAIMKGGVDILRVHNVEQTREMLEIFESIEKGIKWTE